MISTEPSGQSFTFTGITLADLHPGTLEFHHDQVMEDRLEEPFGFSQDEVGLVSREALLTPEAPHGAITDGHQTRDGVFRTDGPDDGTPDTDPGDDSGDVPGDGGAGDGNDPGDGGSDGDAPGGPGDGQDVYSITWNWAAVENIANFDPFEDVLDFGSLSASDIRISEVDDDLQIDVLNNGGHQYVLAGIQAEDLQRDNLTAPDWNDVLDGPGGVVHQLADLGFVDIA